MIALNSAEVLKFYKTEEVCSNLNFLISPIIFRVHFAEHKSFTGHIYSVRANIPVQVKSRITRNQIMKGLTGHCEMRKH